MSPEQARGRSLDRRTDIWSFGCVLYECLTARQAFAGETVSDVIASILQGEPDWKALPANTPPRLRELLARCLTKDAKKRLRDIGEARLLLEGGDAASTSGVSAAGALAPPPARAPIVWPALAALFALSTAALAALLLVRSPEPAPVRRTLVQAPQMPPPPRDPALANLSPDGTILSTVAADSLGSSRLWLRPLDAVDGRFVPGTEDAGMHFWSPDGRYIGFSTQDRLKKLDLRGGSPEVLGPIASYGRGGSWGSRGVIVYSGGAQGPLYRISPDGGTAEPASTLDSAETAHRFPRFLPDGRHFLYAALPPRGQQFSIYVGRIDDAKWRERLMIADGTPVYVEPGWLLYTRNERVLAHRFDARARKLIGEPIALADEPVHTGYIGSPSVVAGTRGPFAYFRPQTDNTRLVWLPRGARDPEPLAIPPGPYDAVALSPRGDQAVVGRSSGARESDLWLVDLQRSTLTRFTFGPGQVDRPVWSADGTRVAFSSDRQGRWDIYLKPLGAGGSGDAVVEGGSQIKYADAFTPDGRTLIYEQLGEKTGWDVYSIDLEGDRTPRPLLHSTFDEQYGDVSPDGRWLAYISNESGRTELHVASYPDMGHRQQISTSGANFPPKWRTDGRELFFIPGDGFAYVGFDPKTGRATGNPREFPRPEGIVSGVMAPDLARILLILQDEGSGGGHALTLVDHWRNELRPR
jgi:Tol biopolymer transport system component